MLSVHASMSCKFDLINTICFEGKETEENWKKRELFWKELSVYLNESYTIDDSKFLVTSLQPLFPDLIKTVL